MRIGLAVVDKNLHFVRVNDHLAWITGVSVAEHLGKTPGEIYGEIGRQQTKMLKSVIEKGEPVLGIEYQRAIPSDLKGGMRFWLVDYIPIKKLSEDVEKVVVTVTEITDQKRVASALNAAKEAAESASQVKSEFLDVAAHELKTPLTSLVLLVESTQKQVQQGKPVSLSNIDRIIKQVKRTAGLVEDLLGVSRLERGALPLHAESVDLFSIVSDCLENYKTQVPGRAFLFEWTNSEGPDGPIFIEIDAIRIYQVLSNFIDNAVKYSPEESPIEIKMEATSEKIRISVIDHGPGIPKKDQGSLFTRFFRVTSDKVLQHPGLGLGLYICRRIIELHGGTVGMESVVGRGSTFFFELPRKGVIRGRLNKS